MATRFRRTKRFVVATEIILGSLFLAAVTATMSHFFVNAGSLAGSELTELTRAIAVGLLVGVVLFVDGLRRGRTWW